MSADILIRTAEPGDAGEAAHLLHAAQGQASVPVHGRGSQARAVAFYEWMFREPGTFWSFDLSAVAVAGKKIVGLLGCYPNDDERSFRTVHNSGAIRAFYDCDADGLADYCRRAEIYADGTPACAAVRGIYIMNLAVKEEFRRRGIADLLLQVAEDKRSQQSYECCCLHVETDNTAARQLFQTRGYVTVAEGGGPGCEALCGFDGYLYMVKGDP